MQIIKKKTKRLERMSGSDRIMSGSDLLLSKNSILSITPTCIFLKVKENHA